MARQARAVATRETIVAAAGRVFSRSSYASATMANVIAEAGVTQGALYFHFPSKSALAEEIIVRQHDFSIAAGDRYLWSASSGLEGIVLLSADLGRSILGDPIVKAGLRLSTESFEYFPDLAVNPYTGWIDTASMFLKRAAAEGDLRENIDIASTAFVIISAFTGTQVVAQATDEELILSLERMWTILFPGIVSAEKGKRVEDAISGLREWSISK